MLYCKYKQKNQKRKILTVHVPLNNSPRLPGNQSRTKTSVTCNFLFASKFMPSKSNFEGRTRNPKEFRVIKALVTPDSGLLLPNSRTGLDRRDFLGPLSLPPDWRHYAKHRNTFFCAPMIALESKMADMSRILSPIGLNACRIVVGLQSLPKNRITALN